MNTSYFGFRQLVIKFIAVDACRTLPDVMHVLYKKNSKCRASKNTSQGSTLKFTCYHILWSIWVKGWLELQGYGKIFITLLLSSHFYCYKLSSDVSLHFFQKSEAFRITVLLSSHNLLLNGLPKNNAKQWADFNIL